MKVERKKLISCKQKVKKKQQREKKEIEEKKNENVVVIVWISLAHANVLHSRAIKENNKFFFVKGFYSNHIITTNIRHPAQKSEEQTKKINFFSRERHQRGVKRHK